MDDFFSVGFRYEGMTFIKRVRSETYFMYTYAISKKINNCLFTLNKQIIGDQTIRKNIRTKYNFDFDNLAIWTSSVQPGLIWHLSTEKDDCYLSRIRNVLEFKAIGQESPTKIELYPNPLEEKKKKKEKIIKDFVDYLISVNNKLFLQINDRMLFIEQLTTYIRDDYSPFVESELLQKKDIEILKKLIEDEANDCKTYFQNFIQSEKSASYLKSLISPNYVTKMYPEMKEKRIENQIIQETIDSIIDNSSLFPSVFDTKELLASEVQNMLMYDPVQSNNILDIEYCSARKRIKRTARAR